MAKRRQAQWTNGTIVYAANDLIAHPSADVPLFSPGPSTYPIPKGTPGLFAGEALGEVGVAIVEFEHDNDYVRVEVPLTDLTI